MKKGLLLFMVLILMLGSAAGKEPLRTDTLSVKVYFRRGYSVLEPAYRDNAQRLDSFIGHLKTLQQDPVQRIQGMHIVAGSSPEGMTKSNKVLSQKRAERVAGYIRKSIALPDSLVEITPGGEDWEGLEKLVEASKMPYRDEVLDILRNTPEWVVRNGKVVDSRKRQLGMLRGGRAWNYMDEHLFPELRSSGVSVVCRIVCVQEPEPEPDTSEKIVEITEVPVEVKEEPVKKETVAGIRNEDIPSGGQKPFCMALKTNLFYDAALVPNIGAEFHLGRGWSVGASWMYAWWKSDRRHNYWRTYGGELDVRKYFGRRAGDKPLTGHHIGLYLQALTYDFELGGKGYLGGKPGGTLLDKASYGAGIEYGYSLPVTRRLNLDFGIGVGYLGGEYMVYDPADTHYVWKQTRQRHWFGPTKAEVSLVWLLGRGNYNEKKGGKR